MGEMVWERQSPRVLGLCFFPHHFPPMSGTPKMAGALDYPSATFQHQDSGISYRGAKGSLYWFCPYQEAQLWLMLVVWDFYYPTCFIHRNVRTDLTYMWVQFKLKCLVFNCHNMDGEEESIFSPFVTRMKLLSLCPNLAWQLAHK